jgi:hypothetical protein
VRTPVVPRVCGLLCALSLYMSLVTILMVQNSVQCCRVHAHSPSGQHSGEAPQIPHLESWPPTCLKACTCTRWLSDPSGSPVCAVCVMEVFVQVMVEGKLQRGSTSVLGLLSGGLDRGLMEEEEGPWEGPGGLLLISHMWGYFCHKCLLN